jgi:dTDP-4-dehydrorhamnose reductase
MTSEPGLQMTAERSGLIVAVLGATGYLGSAIAAELSARPGVELLGVRGVRDLAQAVVVPGVVVYCVGFYGKDQTRLQEANVEQARAAAEFACDVGARLLHVSSSAVFDAVATGELTETTPPQPRSRYGLSKLDGEQEVNDVYPRACIIRPAKLFGGVDPRGRLHVLVRHVIAGRPLPAPESPALWANFVWVKDAAKDIADTAVAANDSGTIHLAATVPWPVFLGLLGKAADRTPARPSVGVERTVGLAAALVERVPPAMRPRRAERVLELWDQRRFVDSRARFGEESLLAGLREVVASVGG